MTDATSVDYAYSPATGTPVPRITVGRPKLLSLTTQRSPGQTTTAKGAPPDDWSDVSSSAPAQQATQSTPDDWSDVASAEAPPTQPDQRQIGAGEAGVRGAIDAATFGLAPALVGLQEAGKVAVPQDEQDAIATQPREAPGLEGMGAALANMFSSHPDQTVRDAFEKGRQDTLNNQQQAHDQHKLAYFAGQLAGGFLTPAFGAGGGGTLAARLGTGAAAGAIGGGLYSAGSDVSAEKPLSDIASDTAIGGVEGGVLGGALKGAIGPRAPNVATTPGTRAAAVADALGAPIPKGVASDNRAIRSATSATASIPLIGARVRNAIDATREAAGNVVNQSGIDEAINTNRGRIDALYNDVRGRIDPDRVMPMPRTAAALARVRANRVAARQPNPDQGLEQFDNIATQGASFNGAHRARVDAREAGDAVSPHPGYNAADYNQITRAMTSDLQANVHALGGPRALQSFQRAEQNFGPISEANKFLSDIAKKRGPGAGLDEIGFNPATNEFSLDKFVSAWNKINPQIRPFIPDHGHANNIEAIFEMGTHIKSSMRERNTSHTSTPLIMWDLARDAIMTGAAVGMGAVSGASVLSSGAMAAPIILFMHWLASPARASSMAAWARQYQGIVTRPTPARVATFKLATRNLANNLGLDPAKTIQLVQSTVQGLLPGRAEDQGSDENN